MADTDASAFESGSTPLQVNASLIQDDICYHSIWTPEMVELKVPLAGLMRRLLARMIDEILTNSIMFGIAYVGIYALIGIFAVFYDTHKEPTSDQLLPFIVAAVLVVAVCLLVKFMYYWVFTAFNRGRTLGKLMFRVRVVSERMGTVNPWTCLARSLFDILDFMLMLAPISMIMIATTRKEKRLADFAAGTIVIREVDIESNSD